MILDVIKLRENKVALVTGSSKGIGSAIIKKLAQNGYDVVINYNNSKNEANLLKKEVEEKYNIKALVIKCDITKEEEIKNIVGIIESEFKKIDLLVNNAVFFKDSFYEEKTKKDFMKILEVNLVGTFLVSKYVGNIMLNNKKGSIINISSNNALYAYYPESIDYDASKAAVISLTKNMAIQYAPYIKVNCIAPGWVETYSNKNIDDEFKQQEINKILLKRFAREEEVANVVLFLASEDASYINGSIICVDGGYRG